MKFKVAFIGCGRATENLHLPALQKIDNVEVVALADTNSKQMNAVAGKFNIKNCYEDYRAILTDPSVDIVAVCVPVRHHFSIAMAVIESGKHLLVEKPLTLTLDEADTLVRAAESTDKKIMVGFNLRHHRLIQEAKKMLDNGDLGEIESIRSQWTSAIRYKQQLPDWRNSREQGGGALFEIGVHHFDLWRYLLKSDIAEISAHSKSQNYPDETVTVTAKMENGVVASAMFSEIASDHNELEICGSKGRLRISLFQFDGLEFFPIMDAPGGIDKKVKELINFAKQLPTGIAIARQGGDFLNTYYHEWQYFLQCIENNEAVESSLTAGRQALEAVLSAIASADSPKAVNSTEVTSV